MITFLGALLSAYKFILDSPKNLRPKKRWIGLFIEVFIKTFD